MTTEAGRKRSVAVPDALWNELRLAAAMRSAHEDDHVSISELVRRGARREVAANEEFEADGEYPEPGFHEDE